MKRQSKAFEIALSAVACAVATIFLTLGSLAPWLLATGYIVGCFALMVPLSKGFVVGDLLAFLGASILSLLFGGFAFFWKLLPFYVFFGLHPLVNYLQLKYKWSAFLCLPLKTAWFDGAMFLCWKFAFDMVASMDWVNEYILLVICIGCTLFFFIYDRMIFLCQRSVNAVVARIKK